MANAERPAGAANVRLEAWSLVFGLRCRMVAEVPARGFTVADLARLQGPCIVNTNWNLNQDIPVAVSGKVILWGRFEAAGAHRAVRITEIASGEEKIP
ncbi:MAG TPA: FliM/FliN family flagellar motor C-terminal domain-containing protein [Terriglobales bacterium]|nr:FliM/FliN family flagellar motor C-terminal domain-containing protein [Terriglobales bacterium]